MEEERLASRYAVAVLFCRRLLVCAWVCLRDCVSTRLCVLCRGRCRPFFVRSHLIWARCRCLPRCLVHSHDYNAIDGRKVFVSTFVSAEREMKEMILAARTGGGGGGGASCVIS